MTWGEFKEKMQQRGVTDNTPICTVVLVPGCDEFELAFHADGAVDVSTCATDA